MSAATAENVARILALKNGQAEPKCDQCGGRLNPSNGKCARCATRPTPPEPVAVDPAPSPRLCSICSAPLTADAPTTQKRCRECIERNRDRKWQGSRVGAPSAASARDPEIVAIETCLAVIADLPVPAAQRALRYVAVRANIDLK